MSDLQLDPRMIDVPKVPIPEDEYLMDEPLFEILKVFKRRLRLHKRYLKIITVFLALNLLLTTAMFLHVYLHDVEIVNARISNAGYSETPPDNPLRVIVNIGNYGKFSTNVEIFIYIPGGNVIGKDVKVGPNQIQEVEIIGSVEGGNSSGTLVIELKIGHELIDVVHIEYH